jgi:diguanylate cyclase (GGDEF)-like protein/PAS domain S-box-containing protein
VNVVLSEPMLLPVWRQAMYVLTGVVFLILALIILAQMTADHLRRQRDQRVRLKQAAIALSESERKLRAYAEMSADWSWEQDADLRFRRQADIPLTTLATDVGKTRWEFADPAMSEARWDAHKADLAARRPFRDFRWERIRTDGKRRYMSTSGDPIFDEAGEFQGYHGTGRDITADVEAAEELRLAKDEAEAANRANADLITAVYFANDAIVGLAPDGLIRTWNPAAERLYGIPAAEIAGQNIAVPWLAEQGVVASILREVCSGQLLTDVATELRRPDGRVLQISYSAAPVISPDGVVTGLIVTARDISDRMHAEAAMRASQDQLKLVFRSASVGLSQSDLSGRYNLVNDRFCEIVGRPGGELIGLTPTDISHPDDIAMSLHLMERLRAEGTPFVGEKRYVRPDGSFVWVRNSLSPARDQDGQIAGVVAVVEDITERKQAEDRLHHMAYHDSLTGLANRAQLNDRLAQAVTRTGRGEGSFAVLALDLDRFKVINDTMGHDAGDLLLSEVAARLRNSVRATDMIARVGGDEMIIIQSGVEQPAGATELARRLVEHLAEPYDIGGRPAIVGVSVGIALCPGDGITNQELLRNADVALYRAKREGRGVYRFFEATADSRPDWRQNLEQDLREAIAANRLHLHFQPLFTCATETLAGFEALLRWDHPLSGAIEPLKIIRIAEESGLIMRLGLWILERACSEAARWDEPLRVAVNLSGAQFRDGMLASQIGEILDRSGLPANRLELEVTETLYIDNVDHALATLRALKGLGVRIALDDFGTGFSSLSYLRTFPFDKIKIDRSFVRALGEDESALPLVQAIVAMGHNLKLKVTAEGVETQSQLELLRQERCDELQGFLLGRPMPGEEINRYIGSCHRKHLRSYAAT